MRMWVHTYLVRTLFSPKWCYTRAVWAIRWLRHYAKQCVITNFSSLTNTLSFLQQILQLLDLKNVENTKIGDEVFFGEKRFKGIFLKCVIGTSMVLSWSPELAFISLSSRARLLFHRRSSPQQWICLFIYYGMDIVYVIPLGRLYYVLYLRKYSQSVEREAVV